MNVLVACEFSGRVRDAFRRRGHNAWSCDHLRPNGDEVNTQIFHLRGNVEDVIDGDIPQHMLAYSTSRSVPMFIKWDLMIAFPPCTYLCSSGLHWNKRRPSRSLLTDQAVSFVQQLMDAPIERIAIENPIGCLSTRIRKPDQVIQPWQFGHPESKSTCLWLKNLPLLQPTNVLQKPESGRWSNQTASGQNRLGPSPDRWKERSKTYLGIAEAMAVQWGDKW